MQTRNSLTSQSMEKEKKFPEVPPFVFLFIFTGGILVITVLTAYFPVYANIPFNVIFPGFVLLFGRPIVFFEKLKLATLLILRVVIVFPAMFVFPREYYVIIVLSFLIVNILEASIMDGVRHKKWYNSVSGIALVPSIGVFYRDSFWSDSYPMFEAWGGGPAMTNKGIAGTTCWIAAYTIWNWIFVTNEFSSSLAYYHIGILLVPILGSIYFLNPAFWLLLRANSLTFGGAIQILLKEFIEKQFKNDRFSAFVEFTQNTFVHLVMMIINLTLVAVPVILYFS